MTAVGKSCRIEREQTFSPAFLLRFNSAKLCDSTFPFYRSPLLQLFSPFETLIVGALNLSWKFDLAPSDEFTNFDSADGKALVENDRQRTPAHAIAGAYQFGGAIQTDGTRRA